MVFTLVATATKGAAQVLGTFRWQSRFPQLPKPLDNRSFHISQSPEQDLASRPDRL